MHKVKGVIFDLDGTIGNTLPLIIAAFKKALTPLIQRTPSEKEIIETFGPTEEGTVMALAPDHYEKGVKDFLFHYEALHQMCPSPFDGITDLLHQLKNKKVRTALVTGKGNVSTEITLKQFKINEYLELIETGSPYGSIKTEGMLAVLKKFRGIAREEMVYVGDQPTDIIASREAGIPVVAAAWAVTAEPGKLRALQPDAIFYTFPEFSKWLNKSI
jgi:phosphoglycolate phosphatase/pyrophosphatase PpaX